jgi:RHS repeat-associated protein
MSISGSKYSVYVGPSTTSFTLNGTLGTGTFSNDQGGGETLAYNSANGQYTYTTSDGAVLIFSSSSGAAPFSPQTLTYPAGEKLTYYSSGVVTSNLGYQFRPTLGTNGYWSKVVLFNMANETCDPTAATCTLTNSWPTIDFSAGTVNGNPAVTWSEQANSGTGGYTVTETIPITASSSRTVVYQLDANERVNTVTDGNGIWTYTYPDPYNGGATLKYTGNGTSSDPSRVIRSTGWDATTGLVTSDSGPALGSNSYTYDTYQRVHTVNHNGVLTTYTYDPYGRGNVTQVDVTPTSGDTTKNITTKASYPATCSNVKTCNKPQSTTDADNNVTSYGYDASSGALHTITYPAVNVTGVGSVIPVVTYNYTAKNETWKSGTGATVTGSAVYKLTSVSRCTAHATCSMSTNPNDEVLTTVNYADTTHGLEPSSTTAGSNASATPVVQATTSYTYTPEGDVQTIDGPLSASADTTWFSYDLDRRLTGVIGPDPDGAGVGNPNRAVSISYNLQGDVDATSIGTAAGQSSSALSSMSVLQKVQAHYSSLGLKDKDTTYDNTAAVAGISDYNYTPERMVACVAVRNNLTSGDACTQSSGGNDLITKYTFTDGGKLLTIRNGYTSDSQTPDLTVTWANNLPSTVQDGNGKTTTYSYDTFNRISSTCYPDTASATGASSTTDCETVPVYDGNGNIKTRVLRDGTTTLNYTYDALNRLSTKVLPEGTVTYGYNLVNQLTSVAQGTTTLSYTYDQLGRDLTQVGPLGTITSAWDLAGRRTQLTYPDTNYVNYDYLVTGEVQKIRENGATTGVGVLATYAYDALGNRSSVTYGNGAQQTYTPDSLYRLHVLSSSLAGATSSATLGYNPASQVTSLQRNNNNFVWTRGSASYAYSANPLNQYTTNGSTSFTYDALGNLHTSGNTYYCYNSENRLTGVGTSTNCSATATLTYDPAGRLVQVTKGTSTAQFAYDGLNMVGEYNSSGVLQSKYVFGPGTDEPIIEYDSAGNRTFLSADERGSVVALTNSSGTVTATNAYDEYGVGPSTNSTSERFGYTGQMYLNEIGLYYYKNRIYSPTLGRFFQTDPAGYADGPNWYAYARNDPVNGKDSLGLGYGCMTSTCIADRNAIIVTGQRPVSPPQPTVGVDPGAVDEAAANESREEQLAAILDWPQGTGVKPPETKQWKFEVAGKNDDSCYSGEEDSEKTGSIAGSLSGVALEAPELAGGLYALYKGARLGAVLSELGGPEAVPVGLVAGAAVGVGVYLYDKSHNGQLSRHWNGCKG